MEDSYLGEEPSFLPTSIKNGLIWAGAAIILTLIVQVANLSSNFILSMVIGAFTYVFYIIGGYRAVREHREVNLGGHISFGTAFGASFVAVFLAGFLGTLFSAIYIGYIDPGSMQEIMDSTREFMEKMGTDEDIIDQAMEQAELQAQDPFAALKSIGGWIFALIGSAVISLIIAAVMRKDKPHV